MRIVYIGLLLSWAATAHAATPTIDLGAAKSFAILAGSAVTNTGSSIITGDVGIWPGTSVTGFPPGLIGSGVLHDSDAAAKQAQAALSTAYGVAAGDACGTSLAGQDLGGLTLSPGIYCFSTSAQITGTLTLNSAGDPDAVFIFQIAGSLTTAAGSVVTVQNGGLGDDVFWQVGSSATLGANSDFAGNIMVLSSVTLDTGAQISCGRALAQNGAVTLQGNNVSIGQSGCTRSAIAVAIPEAGSAAMLGTLLILGVILRGGRPAFVRRPATARVLAAAR